MRSWRENLKTGSGSSRRYSYRNVFRLGDCFTFSDTDLEKGCNSVDVVVLFEFEGRFILLNISLQLTEDQAVNVSRF